MTNRLANSRSPYLLKSSNQKVDWYPWCEEAFEKAKKEDKPILLSIGGVWCHWCHVMAHESFENEEITKIINENFVAIKVDRDERPDIDRRYQEVVMAMTGSGGWPLTVFLMPDAKAFFGGTYFPPEDRWGRMGFKNLLLRIVNLWKEDREKIKRSAEHLFETLRNYNSANYKDYVNENLLTRGISYLLSSLDYQKGGISGAPKFHHASALELLIIHYYFTKLPTIKEAIQIWLDGMAKGGIYDHLLGGFFRYSTDEDWLVPHFEKMLFDNAELLKIYSIAYKIFSKDLYSYIANGIVDYYKEEATDEKGGFYASQDADIGNLNEGGYYTFTYDELRQILNEEELQIASLYFGITPNGHMHNGKNVIHLNMDHTEIADLLKKDMDFVRQTLISIKNKLKQYREKREKPFIDKTIYASWNGLMISGFCEYYKVFGDEWALEFAKKTANRILQELYVDNHLYHTHGIKGFSEDYVFFARALLDLYEITQDGKFLEIGKRLLDEALDLFWDKENWGFWDTKDESVGLLSIKNRPIQDTPTQSVNGAAPYALFLLYSITGESKYMDFSEKTLQAFSRFIQDVPMASHSYLVSLYAFSKGIYKAESSKYYEELLRLYRPFKFTLKGDVEGIMVCEGQNCRLFDGIEQLELLD